MTSNSTTQSPSTVSPRGIGARAARKREQLRRFDEERRRVQEKLRDEREQLAREVQEAESRERRRQRNQELADQRRLKFILGGVVLAAMREQGPTALRVTAEHLAGLSEADRTLLAKVLDLQSAAHSQACKDLPGGRAESGGPNAVA